MKIMKRRRPIKAASLLCRRFAGGISISTTSLLVGLALLFASGARVDGQQPTAPSDSVKHVLGLENIKPNAKGDLTVQAGALQFKTSKAEAEVSVASVQDVFTGQDFKQLIGGTVGTLAKMGVPYGGGRVLSLFQEKIDVLTVEYQDANGGLHGAIFTLPKGQAPPLKRKLMALGAHASISRKNSRSQRRRNRDESDSHRARELFP
jgi:hypothetical protein